LIGVLGVSFSAILVRMSSAPPLIIAAYRMLFTIMLLLPVGIIRREEFKSFTLSLTLLSIVSGLLLSAHFALWISSLQYTSIASSTVIVTTQPIFVLIGSYFFFNERFTIQLAAYMVAAFIGSALIGYGDFFTGTEVIKGDLYALGGALFIAGYMLIGRIVRQKVDVIPYTLVVYSTAAVFLFSISRFTGTALFSYPMKEFAVFFSLAVFSTVFGHTIFNWAIKYVSAVTVSTSILGEPIGATLLAILLLQEYPTYWQTIGGVIVIGSLFLFMREQSKIRT